MPEPSVSAAATILLIAATLFLILGNKPANGLKLFPQHNVPD